MNLGSKPAGESASVADTFLLDTSAFLAPTDKEAGAERVRDLLRAARRGELDLHASFVSLTEARLRSNRHFGRIEEADDRGLWRGGGYPGRPGFPGTAERADVGNLGE
jgi:hypothetical protein